MDRIDDFDRFDCDANGNMVARNKGLSSQQTLVWDAQNLLAEVQDNNGDMVEQYWYDVDGGRVKKVSGTTTAYTFFGHYEEEVVDGTTTAISHFSFGSLRIAVKRGNTLYHLHGDHLGSTSLTTAGSAVEASRTYYAYGSERAATGELQTDRTFTGQKRDATGLMYYNARYYDPALGTFISPDSMVPNPASVIDHNRFLYARGNPLKYSDPSGYASDSGGADAGGCSTRECWEEEFYWKNRYYEAHGFAFNSSTGHWDKPIRPRFADAEIFIETLKESAVLLSQVPLDGWLSIGTLGLSDITLDDVSNAFDRWVTDPFKQHLPENVVTAMEFMDSLLGLPGFSDALLATVGAPPTSMVDDLFQLRRVGQLSRTATLARLDIGGRTFYGRSARGVAHPRLPGTTYQSLRHAEGDVLSRAVNAGMQADEAILYVDRMPCRWCRNSFAGFARSLGLKKLEVYSPEGLYGRYDSELDRFILTGR